MGAPAMKIVYIAGPYRGNLIRRVLNIWRARQAALFVWQHGGVALCPHLNTALFDGKMPDATWLEGDTDLLQRCDAVWTIDGWDRSVGALVEDAVACAAGLPRLRTREDVVAYLGAPAMPCDRTNAMR